MSARDWPGSTVRFVSEAAAFYCVFSVSKPAGTSQKRTFAIPVLFGNLLAIQITLDWSIFVFSFLLQVHGENPITKAPPVQRAKSSTGLLLVQMHETEAPTPSRHYICRQVDRPDSTKLGEQSI